MLGTREKSYLDSNGVRFYPEDMLGDSLKMKGEMPMDRFMEELARSRVLIGVGRPSTCVKNVLAIPYYSPTNVQVPYALRSPLPRRSIYQPNIERECAFVVFRVSWAHIVVVGSRASRGPQSLALPALNAQSARSAIRLQRIC